MAKDFNRPFPEGVIAPQEDQNALLAQIQEADVRYLRLIFTDIMGHNKNVEVPASQFDKALRGEIMFDGSSIEGFTRIEESDMLLVPDLRTYAVFPYAEGGQTVARLICDVYHADRTPFAGCPRLTLRRLLERFAEKGLVPVCGPELEFFLFHTDDLGKPTTMTHDIGGYFDLSPVDLGEDARRDIVEALEAMGFEIEAAHHEVAPGQHEIDFKYAEALETADRVTTFRMVVKKVAQDYGLHATFMPKPLAEVNGSGMHTHQSLFQDVGGTMENIFFDPDADNQLSEIMLHYIGGLLHHARAFVAITNPLVNSYKRLMPGYEAPTNVAWSDHNRSPLIRVPARRRAGTRCEVRVPDPACNPYLAFTVMLAAGLDGIENQRQPAPPVNRNVFGMSEAEKSEAGITQLPRDLWEAVAELEGDEVMREALGEHIFTHFISAKRAVWQEYIAEVSPWELDRYLGIY
ncbi:type I glutamate--ammonia ligase [bacterium]|nr:type I glutamate--ammonia ligase [bacterium]PJA76223.1 MAG: type I glutamate--ammonia ligase [bacterium CG_4_9_14_3_um_filter_65_15]